MKFDSEIIKPCLVSTGCGDDDLLDPRCADPAFRALHPEICGAPPPPVGCSDPDYRLSHLAECGDPDECQDSDFAAANPGLCIEAPRLILKPEYAQREVGKSVLYQAYLLINGEEELLTANVLFSSGGSPIAAIGSTSGQATALQAGIATISASYGLLTAYAQLEVIAVNGCESLSRFYATILDVSRSSMAAFGGLFPTRLSMQKDLNKRFIANLGLDKDHVNVATFDTNVTSGGYTNTSLDRMSMLLQNNVAAINPTGRTAIASALSSARDTFDEYAVAENQRVYVLYSDGENNEGSDPVALAQSIKESGSVIIVVGIRAKDVAFRLLDRISSGGFFINALPSNASSVPGWLSGLTSYLCSGNCEPTGTHPQGQLNYTGFLQWDVESGVVDLIGKVTGGPELFDFLPGNGLYTDMCGSAGLGSMITKEGVVSLTPGDYTLRVNLAGNQRQLWDGDVVRIQVVLGGSSLLLEDVPVATYAEPTDFTYAFTVAEGGPAIIRIQQLSIGAVESASGESSFGCLLMEVELTDSLNAQAFFDDFDSENDIAVPPICGDAGGYSYGPCDYGSGCLNAPIPAQIPDPSPLPTLE